MIQIDTLPKYILLTAVILALIIIIGWMLIGRDKKREEIIFKERDEKLYKRSTFCICEKPILMNFGGETTVCNRCGEEFTDESTLNMRKNDKNK